jgi:hypothetical protein
METGQGGCTLLTPGAQVIDYTNWEEACPVNCSPREGQAGLGSRILSKLTPATGIEQRE